MPAKKEDTAIKGFYPPFEIGQQVYYRTDPEAYPGIVYGYAIIGERHEKKALVSFSGEVRDCYPFELTAVKPVF